MPTYKKSTEGVAALMKRYETAKQHRSSWESHWKECYEYALPQREVFSDHAEGAKNNAKIYDSKDLIGTQRFASRLQSDWLAHGACICSVPSLWLRLCVGNAISMAACCDGQCLLCMVPPKFSNIHDQTIQRRCTFVHLQHPNECMPQLPTGS